MSNSFPTVFTYPCETESAAPLSTVLVLVLVLDCRASRLRPSTSTASLSTRTASLSTSTASLSRSTAELRIGFLFPSPSLLARAC